MNDDKSKGMMLALKEAAVQKGGKKKTDTPPIIPPQQKPAGLKMNRKLGARTVRFNHSVDVPTSETFYRIANENGWTMNHTLTQAAKLLDEHLNSEDN